MSNYMRQAITTKYLGPSNVRGARVKATCEARTIILPWNHALNVDDNHRAAARKLAELLEWNGTWYGGAPAGNGYCFVLADEPAFCIIPAVAA